ncbi:hypothetical protein [Pseudoduganella violacea]|uniref:Uncharacterized protein n=1 Tax=Pseudoduganella violacea TaxID=1715466 RepID=A0A7W5FTV1_9BURK|nr:hypothetical protein [Pseudoduganella violacea]MBB3119047.1 hypothetical protein [Pseudoduganella violacea]
MTPLSRALCVIACSVLMVGFGLCGALGLTLGSEGYASALLLLGALGLLIAAGCGLVIYRLLFRRAAAGADTGRKPEA